MVPFVGSAVSRYDIDELEESNLKPSREKFVEVKRPDGTVAKSRGERTFYGAFTGGFSAGYWGTVGSKEGWEPASFSSSRSKRDTQARTRVEDLMDEEDLRDHQSTHRLLETKGAFAATTKSSASGSILPGGLPRELEEELFPESAASRQLGARLLSAGEAADGDGGNERSMVNNNSNNNSSNINNNNNSSNADGVGRRRVGPQLPPGMSAKQLPRGEEPATAPQDDLTGLGISWKPHVAGLVRSQGSKAMAANLSAELERMWRCKTDVYGVGYCVGGTFSSSSSRNSAQAGVPGRLFLSNKSSAARASNGGYADFGTGVFDMEDHDTWEEIYDPRDKHSHYHAALQDEDDPDSSVAQLGGRMLMDAGQTRSTSSSSRIFEEGVLQGFGPASAPDSALASATLSQLLSKWLAPPAPRSFRGLHLGAGGIEEEARNGSKEHKQLLEFLESHGDRRLIDPQERAALLGLRARGPAAAAAAAGPRRSKWDPEPEPPKNSNDFSGSGSGDPRNSNTSSRSGDPSSSSQPMSKDPMALARDASAPLWAGVDDDKKKQLLQTLGRSFVSGEDQDMDGKSGRHTPFKSDPEKQKRYTKFCLAMEGKASAAEALEDRGNLTKKERDEELAEFGRVFKMFKRENPDADMSQALSNSDGGPGVEAVPVLKRTVAAWTPDKLLCRRWGVPEPRPDAGSADMATKRQREYGQQVQAGLARVMADVAPGPATSKANAGFSSKPPAVAPAAPAGATPAEPPRPPKSLFASIFGDDDDDDE